MALETVVREVQLPSEITLRLPDGVAPQGHEEHADALFCEAIGHADGIAQHVEARLARGKAGIPDVLARLAATDLRDAEGDWWSAYFSGDADRIRSAALARHAAAETYNALAWRPPAFRSQPTDPAILALKAGMDERVTLRCHWAVLVGPSGLNRATVEQWGKVGGLGWSAALIRPLVDRYADALRVLDSNTETSGHRLTNARAYCAEFEATQQQVRALAGLDNTAGAYV